MVNTPNKILQDGALQLCERWLTPSNWLDRPDDLPRINPTVGVISLIRWDVGPLNDYLDVHPT